MLYVVSGNGPTVLGRNWLNHIRLDWASIKVVQAAKIRLTAIVKKYSDVFRDTTGTMTKHSAHLSLQPQTTPVFRRPRAVPYAIRADIDKELDRLEVIGTLRKVEHATWAAPIVPVPQKGWRNKDLWGLQADHKPLPQSGSVSPSHSSRPDGMSDGWKTVHQIRLTFSVSTNAT